MNKKTTIDDLAEFNQGLLDGTSKVGKIISQESIRKSSENLRKVYETYLVDVGAAVRVNYY